MADPVNTDPVLQTDEQIRRATIGEPNEINATITISDYEPTWPVLFEREALQVRTAVGEQVLLIEHVGSTSVPGLAAKPLIECCWWLPTVLPKQNTFLHSRLRVTSSEFANPSGTNTAC